MFGREFIAAVKFLNRHAVGEFFFGAEVINFDRFIAVKTGNLFAKSAVHNAVFQSDDRIVAGNQMIEQLLIQPGDETRVYQRGLNAVFKQFSGNLFGEGKKASKAQYGYFAAL